MAVVTEQSASGMSISEAGIRAVSACIASPRLARLACRFLLATVELDCEHPDLVLRRLLHIDEQRGAGEGGRQGDGVFAEAGRSIEPTPGLQGGQAHPTGHFVVDREAGGAVCLVTGVQREDDLVDADALLEGDLQGVVAAGGSPG